MTYLPTQVIGQWFYLYLILDLYSRKVVGWAVHAEDASTHAAHLVRRTALSERIAAQQTRPVLHGDNGATLKATSVLAMLQWLRVEPSYSRPRVSDDNAYAEALFRTAKYRPEFPARGFKDLPAAQTWASGFVHWYNVEHRHSGIRYVSPAQRHAGEDKAILAARHALYLKARWSGDTRDWSHIKACNAQRMYQMEFCTNRQKQFGTRADASARKSHVSPYSKLRDSRHDGSAPVLMEWLSDSASLPFSILLLGDTTGPDAPAIARADHVREHLHIYEPAAIQVLSSMHPQPGSWALHGINVSLLAQQEQSDFVLQFGFRPEMPIDPHIYASFSICFRADAPGAQEGLFAPFRFLMGLNWQAYQDVMEIKTGLESLREIYAQRALDEEGERVSAEVHSGFCK